MKEFRKGKKIDKVLEIRSGSMSKLRFRKSKKNESNITIEPSANMLDVYQKVNKNKTATLNLEKVPSKNLSKHERSITLPSIYNRKETTARYESVLSIENSGLRLRNNLPSSFDLTSSLDRSN